MHTRQTVNLQLHGSGTPTSQELHKALQLCMVGFVTLH